MIVAIDGPAGVGKSTIAKAIAQRSAFFYISSGKFYRAVTLYALEQGIDVEKKEGLVDLVASLSFSIRQGELYIGARNVEPFLHTDRIDALVATVSAYPPLREEINKALRKTTAEMNVVMEGRDITTVVFPDAEVKIFLDASVETRAMRRFRQGTSELSYDELVDSIRSRDTIDREKPVGGLKVADDALYIDSSDLTIDQVCEKVVQEIFRAEQKVNQEKDGSDD
ncbi:(d)CMP kinase [Sediminispirochaeta smaragdinae]|uniref:Cytidylate kinase n=1 Tax=Sediminispirochaeta smaragdinae (strain DSM 11293 / JCM 15392 / SEBR 4228) TaxID=573413 RepID=E1R2Z1_SEDSS|nr:(d)CMP kinase [Sediminispirochaeta smaragdinae]ADK81177.1 cytidylate kinase [Sediminispirochaeta smaragdinae DSM 11293]